MLLLRKGGRNTGLTLEYTHVRTERLKNYEQHAG